MPFEFDQRTIIGIVDEWSLRETRDAVAALLQNLKWRANGLGVLQAYIREGDTDELRVHIWHPSLEKPGIRYSGKIHDHRFDLTSTVLLGAIGHVEYSLTPDDNGAWQTWEVVNARKALSSTGTFDGLTTPDGNRYRASTRIHLFRAGVRYSYKKREFHETTIDGLCVTLVRKSNQENAKARILAPWGHEVTHAFADPPPESEWRWVVEHAADALREVAS